MKVRNILIGLLVVLMAFVFISCNDEPEEPAQPDTAQDVVYTLSTKKGVNEGYYDNDKPRLVFADKINEGDTLSLQFRSERDVYQFDIRNGSGKWVYQQDSSALTSFEVGEDGWITLTYTFDSKYYDGSSVTYPQEGFDIRFRGRYFKGDLFEVKNVNINGELIPLKDGDDDGFTLSGFEVAAADAAFSDAKSYAVIFAAGGRPGDEDKTPLMEKVAAGAKPAAEGLDKTGYELEIFTQYDEKGVGYVEESKITLEQLRDLAIEKDTIIYLKYTGIPRTVTFMNGEVQFDQKQALHGTAVAKPATDPTKDGGYQFAAWCSDSGLTTEVNLAETPITADTTFYAKFNKVWNVSFNLNGKAGTAPDTQVIIDGQTATKPATDPKTSGFRFKNWKLNDEVFDFTTATITGDIELMAEWEVAPTVTFTYNYNYEGAPAAEEVPTYIGEPATSSKVADPTRDDYYEFVGWFDAATDGTEYPFTANVEEGDDGLILYAHWAKFAYKLTATQANTPELVGPEGKGKYDLDKFAITFASDVLAEAGKTLSFKYKYVSENENTFTAFSVRGAKKWFSEKTFNAGNYPQSLSSLAAIEGHDGWFYGTYVFPDEDPDNAGKTKQGDPGVGTKDVCTYPGWFKLDIRSANDGALYLGDVIYITDIKLDDQYLDINTEHAEFVKYANPTIERVQIDL